MTVLEASLINPVGVLVPQDIHDDLSKLAAARGCSVADAINYILSHWSRLQDNNLIVIDVEALERAVEDYRETVG